jgi:anaerobic magnesium-protoporphyrin IX monomethyl ester cyclase
MRVALVNPNWSFGGSIYFGCRDAHLPLELGYSRALLEAAGHRAEIIDGQLRSLSGAAIAAAVADFAPDLAVVPTAPSYLFWRCPPPELRVPAMLVETLRPVAGGIVAIGPHGSTTPGATLRKLGADIVIMGEAEEPLRDLADTADGNLSTLPSICYRQDGQITIQGGPHASDMAQLPALFWDRDLIERHGHHHHRFDAAPTAPGAEMETSRGCPYHCTFCAKDNFRESYRRRPLDTVLAELDALIAQGVGYVYFIDEIFLPNRALLKALVERPVRFGIQTRIDLWNRDMLVLLGAAGCVSIEAGIESLSREGRERLDKRCRLSTDELTDRLVFARRHVAFVQANLIEAETDSAEDIAAWRTRLRDEGVWANEPVPLFPYPGSPEYRRLWGQPDDAAWERAHAHYIERFTAFSDIQEQAPRPLEALEQCVLHAM